MGFDDMHLDEREKRVVAALQDALCCPGFANEHQVFANLEADAVIPDEPSVDSRIASRRDLLAAIDDAGTDKDARLQYRQHCWNHGLEAPTDSKASRRRLGHVMPMAKLASRLGTTNREMTTPQIAANLRSLARPTAWDADLTPWWRPSGRTEPLDGSGSANGSCRRIFWPRATGTETRPIAIDSSRFSIFCSTSSRPGSWILASTSSPRSSWPTSGRGFLAWCLWRMGKY